MLGLALTLRPLLQLVLVVAVLWLLARVLHQGLLGRIGEAGKFGIMAVLVGAYALSVVLTAMGGSLAPFGRIQQLVRPGPLLIVLVTAAFIWLILRELPFPMPYWAGFVLDSPLRRLFMPADAVLRRMAVGPGMRVVEIGCGTGHLSVEVARRLGSKGTLFCVDIQPKMIEKTRRRLDRAGLDNAQYLVAPANKLPFDIYDADLVFFVAVLGEIPDRLAALREAGRVLRPGAVLSVSEFLPDPHYRFRNDVVRLAEHAGFEPVSVEGTVFSFTANFRKPASKEPLGYVPRFE